MQETRLPFHFGVPLFGDDERAIFNGSGKELDTVSSRNIVGKHRGSRKIHCLKGSAGQGLANQPVVIRTEAHAAVFHKGAGNGCAGCIVDVGLDIAVIRLHSHGVNGVKLCTLRNDGCDVDIRAELGVGTVLAEEHSQESFLWIGVDIDLPHVIVALVLCAEYKRGGVADNGEIQRDGVFAAGIENRLENEVRAGAVGKTQLTVHDGDVAEIQKAGCVAEAVAEKGITRMILDDYIIKRGALIGVGILKFAESENLRNPIRLSEIGLPTDRESTCWLSIQVVIVPLSQLILI